MSARTFWYKHMERFGSTMDTATLDFADAYAESLKTSPLEDDIYDAYLIGCEDKCIPEPKTKEHLLSILYGNRSDLPPAATTSSENETVVAARKE